MGGRRGNVTKLANGLFVSAEGLEEKYALGQQKNMSF